MRARSCLAAVLAVPLAGCGGGAPPALAYGLPTPPTASYDVFDTATISIQAPGQPLDLRVESSAVYDASFASADDGVTVTLSVADLDATVSVPMAGPVPVDESAVTGELVFTLDPRGTSTLVSAPSVDDAVGQLMPLSQIAHSFFPALPGRVVRIGDTWSDTISYEDDGSVPGTGRGMQRSIVDYTAVGDTVIAGAALLRIAFDGDSEIAQTLDMQGMGIEQSTNLRLEGHVLWDIEGGRMFERVTRSTGTGTVRVTVMPAELPTRVETLSRVRLRPE
jgi:hypothetical protein